MANKTLEDRCSELRFRKTPEGVLTAVCSRNPQLGRNCKYQEKAIIVLANSGYTPSFQKPQTASMFPCSEQYQKMLDKKKQVKQSPGWDSEVTYRTRPYEQDAGWKNPLDGE